jgi:DNA-binding MarR family transcriptional regulator
MDALEQRRAYWREYQRKRRVPKSPPPMRKRALTLLTTFILTSRELSSALDISVTHASNILRRLWERGICERYARSGHAFRYRRVA